MHKSPDVTTINEKSDHEFDRKQRKDTWDDLEGGKRKEEIVLNYLFYHVNFLKCGTNNMLL